MEYKFSPFVDAGPGFVENPPPHPHFTALAPFQYNRIKNFNTPAKHFTSPKPLSRFFVPLEQHWFSVQLFHR